MNRRLLLNSLSSLSRKLQPTPRMFQSLCKHSNVAISYRRLGKLSAAISTKNMGHENVINATTSQTERDSEQIEKPPKDAFSIEFLNNRIETTGFQKLLLSVGSSVASLIDPRRHDMIACLGETTGQAALENIQEQMQSTAEGMRILSQKPRINTTTVNIEKLKSLPQDSFGNIYVKFLEDNNVTPDSRMEVRFMDDPELAYIMTRYRECHDLVHTVLGMPTNMLGEVAVKWVEALNNGLPMCYGGAVFGAIRLRPKQRKEYVKRYLPWAIKNGKNMKPLMPVFWEERWEQNIHDLRQELNISPLK